MDTLGLTTLVAYVDGELDAEEVAAVEEHLKVDPEARDAVRKLHQSAVVARSAYDAVLAEPVPERLVEAVLAAPAGPPPNITPLRPPHARWWNPKVTRVAALFLILAMGVGGGFGAATYSSALMQEAKLAAAEVRQAQLAAARNEALETALSGNSVSWTSSDGQSAAQFLPIKTYYSQENGYCREYQRVTSGNSDSLVVHGLACRTEDGTWRPRYELVKDAEIETVAVW